MNNRLPSFQAIEAFVITGKVLNLTAAAKLLHVTPSAVSRRLRSLEEDLGVKLLTRTPQAVNLTSAGRRYYRDLAPALDVLRIATIEARSRTVSTSLRISAPAVFVVNWLIQRINGFEIKHRDINVVIDTQGVAKNSLLTTDECADITIRFDSGTNNDKTEEILMDIVLFPVCSPSLIRTGYDSSNVFAHIRHNKILEVCLYPDLWHQMIGSQDAHILDDCTHVVYDDFLVMYESAARGSGVAVGVDILVDNYIKQNRLVRASDACNLANKKIIISQDNTASKSAPLFLKWLKEEVSKWVSQRYNPFIFYMFISY